MRAAVFHEVGRPLAIEERQRPVAASGEALRIEGEAEVPDWRPSPIQASVVIPRLIR